MDNLEKAVNQSCTEHAKKYPKILFKRYKNSKTYSDTVNSYSGHKGFTRTRALIAVAVVLILTLSTTVLATYNNYALTENKDSYMYEALHYDKNNIKPLNSEIKNIQIKDFNCDYIEANPTVYRLHFSNGENDVELSVYTLTSSVSFDSDTKEISTKLYKFIHYVISSFNGVSKCVWNDGKYIYVLTGNVDENYIYTTAKNVKI